MVFKIAWLLLEASGAAVVHLSGEMETLWIKRVDSIWDCLLNLL